MKRLSYVLFVLILASSYNCQQKKPDSGTTTTNTGSGDVKSVYFDYDDSLIRSDMASVVKNNYSLLKDKNVTIEGNCDERGSNEYNLALGQRRAQSVKNYMVSMGADSSKIRVISYGESKPACNDSDESCWWKNRRADFKK